MSPEFLIAESLPDQAKPCAMHPGLKIMDELLPSNLWGTRSNIILFVYFSPWVERVARGFRIE